MADDKSLGNVSATPALHLRTDLLEDDSTKAMRYEDDRSLKPRFQNEVERKCCMDLSGVAPFSHQGFHEFVCVTKDCLR